MLVNIIKRARHIEANAPTPSLNIFLHTKFTEDGIKKNLADFCKLDDNDILTAIKIWTDHPDNILSFLCKGIVNRSLLKVKYFGSGIDNELLERKRNSVMKTFEISEKESSYLVFTGQTENKTYSNKDEHIHILFKDETIKDISEVDNALINQTLFGTAKKFYICFPESEL